MGLDLADLRESVDQGHSSLNWTATGHMAADPLTKAGIDCVHLSGILRENRYGLHDGKGAVMEVRVTKHTGKQTKIDDSKVVQFDVAGRA